MFHLYLSVSFSVPGCPGYTEDIKAHLPAVFKKKGDEEGKCGHQWADETAGEGMKQRKLFCVPAPEKRRLQPAILLENSLHLSRNNFSSITKYADFMKISADSNENRKY
jgi:hypothetical protein